MSKYRFGYTFDTLAEWTNKQKQTFYSGITASDPAFFNTIIEEGAADLTKRKSVANIKYTINWGKVNEYYEALEAHCNNKDSVNTVIMGHSNSDAEVLGTSTNDVSVSYKDIIDAHSKVGCTEVKLLFIACGSYNGITKNKVISSSEKVVKTYAVTGNKICTTITDLGLIDADDPTANNKVKLCTSNRELLNEDLFPISTLDMLEGLDELM